MYVDFSTPIVSPSVITFPNVTFPDKPLDPSDLKNLVYLTGSESNPPGAVTGTITVTH